LTSICHFKASDRISFNQAVKGSYKQTSVGTSFGPTYVAVLLLLLKGHTQGPVKLVCSKKPRSRVLVWMGGRFEYAYFVRKVLLFMQTSFTDPVHVTYCHYFSVLSLLSN
jgi:hypothetical protein